MYNVNPVDLIQRIRAGANPQQLMISILEDNMKDTPMGENLLLLAKEGKSADIEKIVRNIFEQNNLDFDQEFMTFKQNMGLK